MAGARRRRRAARLLSAAGENGGVRTADALLQVEALCKRFGTDDVLADVSLTAAQGEVLFIIGPSGSGKSTLLRCLNRLEEPSSGRIFVGPDDITAETDLRRARRHFGFVFQSFNLYPHLNAQDNVALALRWAKRVRRREAVVIARDRLAEVGLADKAAAFPAELSGGQQQRVAIARALALSPKILLLDEPTSALDPELVGEVLNTIETLRRTDMTMLIVSHEMRFAQRAADRVVFMDRGRVVETGSPSAVFETPTEARTAAFLQHLRG